MGATDQRQLDPLCGRARGSGKATAEQLGDDSLSRRFSSAARILIARISSSGRSSVVFIQNQNTMDLVFWRHETAPDCAPDTGFSTLEDKMEDTMATLNVKDMPDGLYRRLKERAARERRSLAQEVIRLLTQAVEEPAPLSLL